jgi:phage shock protein C
MSEQKKLYRSSTNRMIGGVCSGLGQYLSIDPVLVRLAFIVLALANGIGVLLYFVMWLVVPGDAEHDLSGEDMIRSNLNDIGGQIRRLGGSVGGQGQAVLGIVLLVAGALFLAKMFIPGIPGSLVWPIALILLGVFLLARR